MPTNNHNQKAYFLEGKKHLDNAYTCFIKSIDSKTKNKTNTLTEEERERAFYILKRLLTLS